MTNEKIERENTYVITRECKFWTGKSWSEEYPDAKLFKVLREAQRECDILDCDADIWLNYGDEDEELV